MMLLVEKKKGQDFLILYILLPRVIVIEDTEWHGFVFKDLYRSIH